MFFLVKNFFSETRLIFLSVLLFVTTPFVATQVKETMLDLPLMMLFLAHVLFFIRYLSNRKLSDLIVVGIFLGLATSTKFGAYTLGVLFLDLVSIVKLRIPQSILTFVFYCGTVFLGYVLAFTSYFLKHHNPRA